MMSNSPSKCAKCNGLKQPHCECFDDNLSIDIVIRDVNGKRTRVHFADRNDLYAAIQNGCLTDEDEVLLVFVGCQCIYSALMAAAGLTIEDLTGFFG